MLESFKGLEISNRLLKGGLLLLLYNFVKQFIV